MKAAWLVAALALTACEPEATPDPPAAAAEAPADPEVSEPLRLGVPPRAIARARQEAAGLYRMPTALRLQTLERRRALPAPTYAELRADADAHANERASFEGQVGFVRTAGPRLWILPLLTRRSGEQWVDPLYVLSTIPPMLPFEGGVVARIDGWVVGARTIGQHTLPLIVGYHVQPIDPPAEAAPSAP
ncbi:MAG: hypothetical protein H6719_17950 [Sandaracinaceae bacterium]|nr:hypothetical protein [Sandaracinaceae bacterium]